MFSSTPKRFIPRETPERLRRDYDRLTRTCEELLAEIRREDPETERMALRDFIELNADRLELARKLGLIIEPGSFGTGADR